MEGMMEGLPEELNFLNDSAVTAVANFKMSESGCSLVGGPVYMEMGMHEVRNRA